VGQGQGRRPVHVFQWAQVPGPVGGVTTSVQALTAGLREAGATIHQVDTGSAANALRAVPSLRWRPALHLFHITRLWRAIVLAPLFALLPGRTVLVLHSGSTRRQLEQMPGWLMRLLRLGLPAYDEIWAVNDEIRDVLPPRMQTRVTVVSPYVPRTGEAPALEPDPDLVTVATNSGLAHYNATLAAEAVALARRERPTLRLWVLAYDQDGPAMAELRREVAHLDWVQVSMNLPPEGVSAALAQSAVFLRPTSWDGDSVIVREALAVGARVVASDVVARPAGVELAALDAEAFAEALLRGGRPSDGAGLATRSVVDAGVAALGRVPGA
jgi:glycosyltransferase involved in cell wall biosynthesis